MRSPINRFSADLGGKPIMSRADIRGMRVLSIVGARPQFVKLAPLHHEISRGHQHLILHTGQHYDQQMNDSFFSLLEIPDPDFNLGVGSGSHGQQTGRMMMEMEAIVQEVDPDIVMLYGDTNSTVAGALVAAKLCLPIAHVEAGPRLHERCNPEEINRKMTDHLSSLLFCSSDVSRVNLAKEGIVDGVHVTGDLMVQILHEVEGRLDMEPLERFSLTEGEYILCTLHRAENVDDPDRLREILSALAELPRKTLLPMHPRTRKAVEEFGLGSIIDSAESLHVCEPLDYLSFLSLNRHASLVITDSGGLQKEAYVFNTPCITIFPRTAWVETVDEGWNRLVPADKEAILDAVRKTEIPKEYLASYGGDGVAARMVELCEELLAKK